MQNISDTIVGHITSTIAYASTTSQLFDYDSTNGKSTLLFSDSMPSLSNVDASVSGIQETDTLG